MFKFIEKWALQRFLKRVANNIPQAKGKIAQIWEERKEEIFEKVCKAIKTTIVKIITEALAKKGVKIPHNV